MNEQKSTERAWRHDVIRNEQTEKKQQQQQHHEIGKEINAKWSRIWNEYISNIQT